MALGVFHVSLRDENIMANLQQVAHINSGRQRVWLLVIDEIAMEARARYMKQENTVRCSIISCVNITWRKVWLANSFSLLVIFICTGS